MVRINYRRILQKPYFHKYWTEIHDFTTVWKRNVCSFIVTLNALDVGSTCDMADVQAILPFQPNHPARPFPWWQMYPLYRNCSYNLRIDVIGGPWRSNCRRNARWIATKLWHRANSRTHQPRSVGDAAISLQHWFTLFPHDGSSDNSTTPNVTFTVCNRREFHDLATLPTQVMA
jgi:hypothetical protein